MAKKTEPEKPKPKRVHTDEELVQLANDMIEGRIYTDKHLPPGDSRMITCVFMPLAWADDKVLDKMREDDVRMIYEYRNQAGPRAINGHPTFLSLRMLNVTDYEKFVELHNKTLDIKKEAEKKIKELAKG